MKLADISTPRFFESPKNFLDPEFTESGELYAPIRFNEIIKERYLICKHCNTSYSDTGLLSIKEKNELLKLVASEIQKNKNSIEKLLSDFGAELVFKRRFLDHHRFDESELDSFFDSAVSSGAELAVATEKDAVRISDKYVPRIPFYYTKLEIDILSGADDFNSAVDRICFPKRKADVFPKKAGARE